MVRWVKNVSLVEERKVIEVDLVVFSVLLVGVWFLGIRLRGLLLVIVLFRIGRWLRRWRSREQ